MTADSDHLLQRLAAAVHGDREALAQLLVEHSGTLARRLASRLELNPFTDFSVEDVLQEVFLDAYRGIGSFRVDAGASFAGWLQKVTDNRLASMLRERHCAKRGGGRRRLDIPANSLRSSVALIVQSLAVSDSAGTSQIAARAEMVAALRNGLAALPDDQQMAVEQYYLQERTLESTADTMAKTTGAVRGLIRRARKTLRGMLGHSSRWF